jgi:hypothetical protein
MIWWLSYLNRPTRENQRIFQPNPENKSNNIITMLWKKGLLPESNYNIYRESLTRRLKHVQDMSRVGMNEIDSRKKLS